MRPGHGHGARAALSGCRHRSYSFGKHFLSFYGSDICLPSVGIWQRCQISPLFHEDGQDGQITIWPSCLVDRRVRMLRRG